MWAWLNALNRAGRDRRQQDVVERLRVAVEAVGVVAGRSGADEVRIQPHRRPVDHLLGWRLIAADDPEQVHVAVADLERVVVTDRHDRHTGVLGLQLDEQLRHRFTLRLPLGSDSNAVNRIVDAVQRAEMVHDDEHVGGEPIGRPLNRRVQHQRRPVVEQLGRAVSRVDVRLVGSPLLDGLHGHAGAREDADIDAADVVAFDEMRLISGQRLAGRRGVGIDPRREILQHGQVLGFLDADDLGRAQVVADDQRRLRQSIGVGRRRQHRVADRGIVDRVEEPLQVEARHLILGRSRSGHAPAVRSPPTRS